MTLKTSGLGLIVLGILLLGAQLVLYLGFKNVHPPPGTGEQHIEPPPSARTTPLPGVFGAISLIAGIALVAKRPEDADAKTVRRRTESRQPLPRCGFCPSQLDPGTTNCPPGAPAQSHL